MELRQVVLIGAGNVSWHLGGQLVKLGVPVTQVYSRHLPNAQLLGNRLNCPATDRLSDISALPDCLYILAVNDDAISAVAQELHPLDDSRRFFVHTSGSVSSGVLAPFFQHYGVFYPLQTFSKKREVDFTKIPICIHATGEVIRTALKVLAGRLSRLVHEIDDEQRKTLHVAAVIVNNFTNHLFDVGQQLVEVEGLSFDLLRPLISETAAKAMESTPREMQTGPARRNDQRTILSHLRYLQRYPDWQNLYRVISHSISRQFLNNKIH